MKPLHGIISVPQLSSIDLASIGRMLNEGHEVRVRTTPKRGYIIPEFYRNTDLQYWQRPGWARIQPRYRDTQNLRDKYAEIAQKRMSEVHFVTK